MSKAHEEQAAKAPKQHLVVIPVTDVERAAEFYTHVWQHQYGAAVPSRRYDFQYGNTVVSRVDSGTKFRPNVENVYLTVTDLDDTYERAKTAGCQWLEDAIRERPWGERSFCARDPFGNPICFVETRYLVKSFRFGLKGPRGNTSSNDEPAGPDRLISRRGMATMSPTAERVLRRSRASKRYFKRDLFEAYWEGDLFLTDHRVIFAFWSDYDDVVARLFVHYWNLSWISEIGRSDGSQEWHITADDEFHHFCTSDSNGWLSLLAERTGITASAPEATSREPPPAQPRQLGSPQFKRTELETEEEFLTEIAAWRERSVPLIAHRGIMTVTDNRVVFLPYPGPPSPGEDSIALRDVRRMKRLDRPSWRRGGLPCWIFETSRVKRRYVLDRRDDEELRRLAREEGWPLEDDAT